MPNSYAIVPNIIPGNVTIGGNLTVGGDSLRLGAVAPFVRLHKAGAGVRAVVSYNVGTDELTRDNAAQQSVGLHLTQAFGSLQHRLINSAGSLIAFGLAHALAENAAVVTNTGNVAENSLYNQVIPANTFLQGTGGHQLRFVLVGTVQGAVATTFRVKIGATVIFSFTRTSIADIIWDVILTCRSTTVLQGQQLRFEAGALTAATQTNVAQNTAVDQPIALTIQNGAAADSWDLRSVSHDPVFQG